MKLLKTYGFSLLLILSISAGLLLGSFHPGAARAIRFGRLVPQSALHDHRAAGILYRFLQHCR